MRTNILLGVLQFFVALGAIPSGIIMIIDATGKTIGLDVEILDSTPFQNYLIPGLFLLFFIGFLQLLGGIYSIKNNSFIVSYGIYIAAMLILWILAQIYLIGYIHILQLIMMGIGIIQLLVALKLHSTRLN